MTSAIQCVLYTALYYNIRMKHNKMALIFFLYMVTDMKLHGVLCKVGGHALFASLSQLEDLWRNEVIIAQLLENMVEKCKNPPASINM